MYEESTKARTFQSSCPIVRSGTVPVATIIDVSKGENVNRVNVFSFEIAWLRKTEAMWHLKSQNGAIQKSSSLHSDYSGLGTSFSDVLAEARVEARELGLNEKSSFMIDVVVSVKDFPCIPDRVSESTFRSMNSFRYLPMGWLDGRRADLIQNWLEASVAERVVQGFVLPALTETEASVVAWSSSYGPEELLSARNNLIRQICSGLDGNLAKETSDKIDKAFLRKL